MEKKRWYVKAVSDIGLAIYYIGDGRWSLFQSVGYRSRKAAEVSAFEAALKTPSCLGKIVVVQEKVGLTPDLERFDAGDLECEFPNVRYG